MSHGLSQSSKGDSKLKIFGKSDRILGKSRKNSNLFVSSKKEMAPFFDDEQNEVWCSKLKR